ncbi:MAG: DUF4860 domain-containing protein [Lachnospiraceae bacterium]|nr:DUF4860 domain-containing protein [Lachnospiraceae bacterium]
MTNAPNHNGISSLFAFLLLGMFALSCVFLTVLGARAYRSGNAACTDHNTDRILSSYIRSMVRTMDEAGVISTENIDGMETLTLTETYDGEAYVTRLYCSGGKLREWFSSAAYPFEPENGTPVCDAVDMKISLAGDLITAKLQETAEREPLHVAVKVFCSGT